MKFWKGNLRICHSFVSLRSANYVVHLQPSDGKWALSIRYIISSSLSKRSNAELTEVGNRPRRNFSRSLKLHMHILETHDLAEWQRKALRLGLFVIHENPQPCKLEMVHVALIDRHKIV
jgi:hypothetical protein